MAFFAVLSSLILVGSRAIGEIQDNYEFNYAGSSLSLYGNSSEPMSENRAMQSHALGAGIFMKPNASSVDPSSVQGHSSSALFGTIHSLDCTRLVMVTMMLAACACASLLACMHHQRQNHHAGGRAPALRDPPQW
eukprot:1800629-Amphidinium_carterae.1